MLQDNGFIYLNDHSNYTLTDNSIVAFNHNIAGGYGEAMYALLKENSINSNILIVTFTVTWQEQHKVKVKVKVLLILPWMAAST